MNYYPNNNQFYNQPMQPMQPMQQVQPIQSMQQILKVPSMEQQYQPFVQQQQTLYKQNIILQGKSVDSIDVVKAMDIPLDGSISYFPLTDGTAIVTKQLQQDGSSKTIVYKPVEEKESESLEKFITVEELDERMKKIDNSFLKEEIKNIKRQIKDLRDDIKYINEDVNEDINDNVKHRKD